MFQQSYLCIRVGFMFKTFKKTNLNLMILKLSCDASVHIRQMHLPKETYCIQATLLFQCMHSLETEPMILALLAQFKLQRGFLKIIKLQNAEIIKHFAC